MAYRALLFGVLVECETAEEAINLAEIAEASEASQSPSA
jgi:hypothetical protein